jgi:hypothetical protein
MMTPTIHLNGTSAKELAEQFANAYSALGEAIRAVNQAAPNGRDYYPQGQSAINEAMAEHRTRIETLNRLRQDMLTLAEATDR